jgi:hypothetical protein
MPTLGSIHVLEDATGEGCQKLRPPVCYQRAGSLRLMRVQAVLKACSVLSGPHVRERLFFGYEGV